MDNEGVMRGPNELFFQEDGNASTDSWLDAVDGGCGKYMCGRHVSGMYTDARGPSGESSRDGARKSDAQKETGAD